jgi:phage shock protein PspC (stress-responsive transcriptional regulator)
MRRREHEDDADAMSTTELPPTPPPPPPGPSGAPGPGEGPSQGPRISADAARDLSRLRRTVNGSPFGRHIAGVAGGLARQLDLDPLVVRILLVVLAVFGPGLLLYVACWLLVPEEGGSAAVIRVDDRTRTVLLWIVVGLSALGTAATVIGPAHGWWLWGPWPWVALGAAFLYLLGRRGSVGRGQPTGGPATDPTSATAAAWAAPATGPVTDPVTDPVTGVSDTVAAAARPQGTAPTWTPRPPDPRRNGPLLFLPTLALIALAEGVLGVLDLAGLDVAAPTYPAVAVAVIAVMLIVGAFVGRAGGLIALGLVGVLVTVGVTAATEIGAHSDEVIAPLTAATVADSYDLGFGHLTVDLTRVADPAGLDGRTLDVHGRVGYLEIEVPQGWGVDLDATVHGGGRIETPDGPDRGGWDTSYTRSWPAAAENPTITLDTDLRFGLIQLRRIP